MLFFEEEALRRFKQHLQNEKVVAAPAEGVYGYCVDPFSEKALHALVSLKERALNKGFVLLIPSFADLQKVAAPLKEEEENLLQQHWPGPVTFILPAKEGLPKVLTGGKLTVAVRLPKKEYMQEYLRAWGGPLVSTSANVSGSEPAKEVKNLDPSVFCLHAPQALQGGVSTIIDIKTGKTLR